MAFHTPDEHIVIPVCPITLQDLIIDQILDGDKAGKAHGLVDVGPVPAAAVIGMKGIGRVSLRQKRGCQARLFFRYEGLIRIAPCRHERHAVSRQEFVFRIAGAGTEHRHICISLDSVFGQAVIEGHEFFTGLKLSIHTEIRQTLIHDHDDIRPLSSCSGSLHRHRRCRILRRRALPDQCRFQDMGSSLPVVLMDQFRDICVTITFGLVQPQILGVQSKLHHCPVALIASRLVKEIRFIPDLGERIRSVKDPGIDPDHQHTEDPQNPPQLFTPLRHFQPAGHCHDQARQGNTEYDLIPDIIYIGACHIDCRLDTGKILWQQRTAFEFLDKQIGDAKQQKYRADDHDRSAYTAGNGKQEKIQQQDHIIVIQPVLRPVEFRDKFPVAPFDYDLHQQRNDKEKHKKQNSI